VGWQRQTICATRGGTAVFQTVVGRAAVGYFIEGISMKEAQKLMRKKSKEAKEPLLLQ